MITMAPPTIACPVCGASGSMLHHDIRSSLVYSCLNCTHEWLIDPDGGAASEPTASERRRTSSPGRRSRPRKS